jgi:hypothetical protein
MGKNKKSSEIWVNFIVDFLAILYQKVKKYILLSKRYPLASVDFMQLNVSAKKTLIENIFGHYSLIQITVYCRGKYLEIIL